MLSMQDNRTATTMTATAAATTAAAALFMDGRSCLPGVPPFARLKRPAPSVKR